MLEAFQRIYHEAREVSKGRGIILYCLSVLAWGVEIGSIALLFETAGEGRLTECIADYLMSAMGQQRSEDLRRFVFISIILMLCVYGYIKVKDYLRERRMKRDNRCV